jgi:uncharacterized FAD-dependent dehydrogenase
MVTTEMDSNGFITSIEEHLVTLAPITKFIITKQLNDLNVTKESMTSDKAVVFINKMTNALVLCLGKDGSELARKMMMKQLRIHAPGYLDNGVRQ